MERKHILALGTSFMTELSPCGTLICIELCRDSTLFSWTQLKELFTAALTSLEVEVANIEDLPFYVCDEQRSITINL